MKELIKRIIGYRYWYKAFSHSFLYTLGKKYYGLFAAWLYGNPSKGFFVIGVTGTNGKTTTTLLLHKIFTTLVGKAIVLTTEGVYIGNQKVSVDKKMTSYDPFTLQKLLATAAAEGCKIAVIEVSSHGLDQHRFAGIEFDVAVLTNISPEHLDYHETLDAYASTKKKLFTSVLQNTKNNSLAVFPKDDYYGRQWSQDLLFDRSLSFGITTNAGVKANNIVLSGEKTTFDLSYLGKEHPVSLRLLGEYNVANVLAALTVALLVSVDLQQAIQVVEEFVPVSGRTQTTLHNGVRYFVDYAHTPDALEKVLTYMNSIKGQGRVLVMRGGAGNRDRTNRPLMGKILCNHSDIFVLTEDDSDTEKRSRIFRDILPGIKKESGEGFFLIPERSDALEFLMKTAQAGDIVLIAGKGHEHKIYTNYGIRDWKDWEQVHTRLGKTES